MNADAISTATSILTLMEPAIPVVNAAAVQACSRSPVRGLLAGDTV
jgi:hypothetical protein